MARPVECDRSKALDCIANGHALGQQAGQPGTTRSAQELANLVVTISPDLLLQNRKNQSSQQLKPIIENRLSTLGPAA